MKIKSYISFVIFIFILSIVLCKNTETEENITTNLISTTSSNQESTNVSTSTTTTFDYNCSEPLHLEHVIFPYTVTNTFKSDTLLKMPSCATSVNNVIVYNYIADMSGTMIIECTNKTLTNTYSWLVVYDTSCLGTQLFCATSTNKYISMTGMFVNTGNSFMIGFFTNNDQAMMVNPKINIEIIPIPQTGEECSQAVSLTNNFSGIITPSSIWGLPSKPMCFSATSFSWYLYPPLKHHNISINLSSDIPIDIAFYTGSTCSSLTLNSCFANTTFASATLYGSSCWIAIGNNSTSPLIRITESPSPFGEDCSNPVELTSGTQTVYWYAERLDYSSSLSSAFCATSNLYSPDIVFTYTTGPTAGAYVEAEIPNNSYDSLAYIVYKECPNISDIVACNIPSYLNHSVIIPNVLANHNYYIVCVPLSYSASIIYPATVVIKELVPNSGEACTTSQTLHTGLNSLIRISNNRIAHPSCFWFLSMNIDWYSFTPSFSNLTFTTDVSGYIGMINSETGEELMCDYYLYNSLIVNPGTKYCFSIYSSSTITSININNY